MRVRTTITLSALETASVATTAGATGGSATPSSLEYEYPRSTSSLPTITLHPPTPSKSSATATVAPHGRPPAMEFDGSIAAFDGGGILTASGIYVTTAFVNASSPNASVRAGESFKQALMMSFHFFLRRTILKFFITTLSNFLKVVQRIL